MPLRIVLHSDLFGSAKDQDVSIHENLPLGDLVREICREFNLPEGSYELVDDSESTITSQTLEEAGIRSGSIIQFRERPGQRTAVLPASDGTVFTLRRNGALIGRPNEKAGLYSSMLDADLSVLDKERQVSRPHAKITQEKDGFWIACVSEVNRIKVNDASVLPGSKIRLHSKDRLQLGGVQLVFEVSGR